MSEKHPQKLEKLILPSSHPHLLLRFPSAAAANDAARRRRNRRRRSIDGPNPNGERNGRRSKYGSFRAFESLFHRNFLAFSERLFRVYQRYPRSPLVLDSIKVCFFKYTYFGLEINNDVPRFAQPLMKTSKFYNYEIN